MRRISLAAAAAAMMTTQAFAGEPLRVAVNMTTVESAPVFLAAQRVGAAAMTLTGGGIPLLVDRTADAATNSETQILLRSVERPDLRVVMTVAECEYRIVARRSAGIRTLGDLRGRKVGTPASTSAEFYLAKMLRTVRLDEPDVKVVPMAVADMAAAMRRGDVDAVSGWEPGAQDSIDALGADAIVFQDRPIYRELFNLNTTAAVLDDPARRRALVDVVRAIVTASRDVRARPADVRPLLSARINVPQATIATVWQHFRFPASLPHDILDVMVEEEQWVAVRQKRGPRNRAQLQTLVDDSVLREALRK
jgi:ABC-type nitrate/sulfonate/bicarbonate transport system substrate-binding protein